MKRDASQLLEVLDKVTEDQFSMWHECGSVCCIGGHAMLHCRGLGEYNASIIDAVQYLCPGMGSKEAEAVCHPPDGHPGWEAMIKDASQLLLNWEQTGDVDWDLIMSPGLVEA